MMDINTIVFDLGGVLIDWNPNYVFDRLFEDPEKRRYFFEHVCTNEWNEEQDAGRSLQEATQERIAKYPEWKEYIEAYYGRWQEMLGGPIHETVTIFRELKECKHYKLYALTNWSAETFPVALGLYEFLHWFDGRVVSGEEKMRKPFREFYGLIIKRFALAPSRTLFIDDNYRNIKGAEEAGLQTIHFQNPLQLRGELVRLGVL